MKIITEKQADTNAWFFFSEHMTGYKPKCKGCCTPAGKTSHCYAIKAKITGYHTKKRLTKHFCLISKTEDSAKKKAIRTIKMKGYKNPEIIEVKYVTPKEAKKGGINTIDQCIHIEPFLEHEKIYQIYPTTYPLCLFLYFRHGSNKN